MARFGIIGCAGYIAPRHLKAIKDTGNELVCALDKSDSVGILDSFSYDTDFFTEFERFDRYADKLRRRGAPLDFISVCTPNYLHDAQIRWGLRNGLYVICEKPMVIEPWNLTGVEEVERDSGKRVFGIMQLRLHPAIKSLKKRIESLGNMKHQVVLDYIASRGKWYDYSWKGDEAKSGGLAMNLGVHFFDMLLWIFGKVKNFDVELNTPKKMRGALELELANVNWTLSCDRKDLPVNVTNKGKSTYRSIKVDGEELEFSEGFVDLHTESYKEILNGRGFGVQDVKPSIELIHNLKTSKIQK